MNKKHRSNLMKLAEGLEGIPEDQFEMYAFRDTGNACEVVYNKVHVCGTSGCAVGWGPFIKGLEAPLAFAQGHSLAWCDYCRYTFGVREDSKLFEWMFGGDWSGTDDTALGASLRIRHYLEYGLPSDAEQQMVGRAPYLFYTQLNEVV